MDANVAQKSLLVPQPLAQAVVNYLQGKPYLEVYQMIAALLQCGEGVPLQAQAVVQTEAAPATVTGQALPPAGTIPPA